MSYTQKYENKNRLHNPLSRLGNAPHHRVGATKPQGYSSAEPQRGIKITMKGIKGKQITVERFALSPFPAESNQGFAKYKVSQAKDGSYLLTLPSDTLYHLMVYPDEAVSYENDMESVSQEHTIELFGNAHTSLSVKAKYSKDYIDYLVGNEAKDRNTTAQELNEACALFKQTDRRELSKGLQQALEAKDYDTVNAIYDKRTTHQNDFRLQHPESDYAAYLLSEVDDSTFLADLPHLSKETRGGILKDYLSLRKSQLDYQAQIAAQALALQQGNKQQAHDFTMPTVDGKQIALGDYKGKYVVLDFWGSWCIWCIKGMPRMKAFYEAHQDKMQLIGVNCADKPALCQASIKNHQMTWPQVVNQQGDDLVMTFGVSTYPTKVIISPDGFIDSIYEGESDDFYKHMEELIKQNL